eukprot:3235532-Amphidinium_carterae.1
MVPNLNVDNLEVIPEPEPERVQSSTEEVHHDFVSVMDSASALDHYEEVNTLMEMRPQKGQLHGMMDSLSFFWS